MVVIAEEKRPINWIPIIGVLLFIGLIGATVYYLFLTETPGITLIAPAVLKQASDILASPLDINEVVNHGIFKALKGFDPLTVSGLGKADPFAP